MASSEKITQMLDIAWNSFAHKTANEMINPKREEGMKLLLAQTIQNLIPVFEYDLNESLKVELEYTVHNEKAPKKNIDILIIHKISDEFFYYPIELKCIRKHINNAERKRGGQNRRMFNYWKDIERLEQFLNLDGFVMSTHFFMTDDKSYVNRRVKQIQKLKVC